MPGSARNACSSDGTTPSWRSTIAAAAACSRKARRGYPSRPQARSTSAGEAAAKSAGVGQRCIHASHWGATRSTGVCCAITSLTSTPHALQSGVRQGSSRRLASYQLSNFVCSVRAATTRPPCQMAAVLQHVRLEMTEAAIRRRCEWTNRDVRQPATLRETVHTGRAAAACGRPEETDDRNRAPALASDRCAASRAASARSALK